MKKWLDEFKLALIDEDFEILEKLLDEFKPENENLEQLKQAKALCDEAFILMQNKKSILASHIEELRKAKEFFKV